MSHGAVRRDKTPGAAGRHRAVASPSRMHPRLRLAGAFPGLLGPGRRAAWRRFVLRRTAAVAMVITGYAIALTADPAALTSLVSR
ncbi:MAG: hypothetical protein ABR500_14755 [Dermatophilaceae bacterium]|nr:hypothetical protein [Intrasporangiaceae bacterium]